MGLKIIQFYAYVCRLLAILILNLLICVEVNCVGQMRSKIVSHSHSIGNTKQEVKNLLEKHVFSFSPKIILFILFLLLVCIIF